MGNFTDKRINQTFQRLVQVNGDKELQDGLGRKLSGSMGNLEVTGVLAVTGSLNITGFPNVSSSIAALEHFSSSLDATYATDLELANVSSSLALETAQLLDFSASLDATYATDSQLDSVSSSLALETAQLLNFSASLDATFATDAQLSAGVDPLTAATSSYAIKTAISGAFDLTSASLASRIAGLDANYATDEQLNALSSSVSSTYLSDAEWTFHSASIRNDIAYDSSRIGVLENKTLVSGAVQLSSSLDIRYAQRNFVSGAFNTVSGALSSRIEDLETFSSSIDTLYVSNNEYGIFSSSLSSEYLSLDDWAFASSSIRNDIAFDSSRIAVLENKTLVSGAVQVTSSLDIIYPRKSQISGSFEVSSSLLSDRIDEISGSLSIYQVTGSSTMPKENSYLVPNIIRGGDDSTTAITASGILFKLEYTASVNGTHTVTLPDASTPENTYRKMRFISDDSVTANDTFTLSGSNAQLIEGSSTYLIDRGYEGVMLWSDGSNWFRIQSKA